jgi:hypothetical protein
MWSAESVWHIIHFKTSECTAEFDYILDGRRGSVLAVLIKYGKLMLPCTVPSTVMQ